MLQIVDKDYPAFLIRGKCHAQPDFSNSLQKRVSGSYWLTIDRRMSLLKRAGVVALAGVFLLSIGFLFKKAVEQSPLIHTAQGLGITLPAEADPVMGRTNLFCPVFEWSAFQALELGD